MFIINLTFNSFRHHISKPYCLEYIFRPYGLISLKRSRKRLDAEFGRYSPKSIPISPASVVRRCHHCDHSVRPLYTYIVTQIDCDRVMKLWLVFLPFTDESGCCCYAYSIVLFYVNLFLISETRKGELLQLSRNQRMPFQFPRTRHGRHV